MDNYLIQILDISQDDITIDEEIGNEYTITLYGKCSDDNNIVCNIRGFEPYYYIKVPSCWSDSYTKTIFLSKIDKYYHKLINMNKLNLKTSVNSYKELYGYHVDESDNIKKFRFLKLYFKTYKSSLRFKRSVKTFYNKNLETKDGLIKKWIDCNINECECCLYESTIPPIIKFIHDKNISPCGWITIKKCTQTVIKNFKSKYEIDCNINDITPSDINKISNFRIASFDLECDSLTGAFPLAIKTFRKPAQDFVTKYYEKINNYSDYSYEEKKYIINQILLNLFDLKSDDEIDIDKVVFNNKINGFKLEDNIELYDNKFIIELDKSLNDKVLRETLIKKINKIFDGFKYSDNKKLQENPIKGDPIIQIGTVFYDYMTKNIDRYLIVMGNENTESTEICSDIDNINVIRCVDEQDLLLKWLDLINNKDPDFITGYNILGFDFKFIYERLYELGENLNKSKITNSVLLNGSEFYDFGRLKNINGDKFYNKRCKYVDKNKQYQNSENSQANQYNTTTMIEMDGRVIFDIQKEIMKSVNLDSYKLDNVSSYFMRGIISDIKTIKMVDDNTSIRYLILKTKNVRQLKPKDYITINTYSNIGEMLFMDGYKFMIDNINSNNIAINITNMKCDLKSLKKYEKIEWCLSKDDVPPSEIFRLHKIGGPDGRAKVGKYCIQDCELCIHLLLSLDIIPNNMGMSNVCMVPLNFIFTRGQGIKVTSVVSKICSDKNTRMPTLMDTDENDDGFEGAIVLDPKPGIYLEDPISVLDFASLYPSCIIEKNCSHETLINDKDYINKLIGLNQLEEKCNIVEYDNYEYIQKDNSKTIKKIKNINNPKTICYYKKSERDESGKIIKSTMGILPTVLDHLLSSRTNIKKDMKKENDPDKYAVLDGLQLAYKITANSVYGQLGFRKSTIFKKEIAACTTSIGREHIYDAERGVYEWANKMNMNKPDIIYGDTDSVFVKFSRIDKFGNELKDKSALKHCIECGIEAGKYITENILKYPQDLEYEKTFYPFVLISKKRYIGDKYESIKDVENNNCKRTSMGIVMKRRDNAPIVKYIYGNVIEKLLIQKSYTKTIEWLIENLNLIVNNKFNMNYFIISKSLNDYYKNPSGIAHKVLADRIAERDPGNKPVPNERIPYAYIKLDNEKIYDYNNPYKSGVNKGKPRKRKILQGDRIESPDYIIDNNKSLDYNYYISNQIQKPIEQLLELHSEYKSGIFDKYN